MSAMRVQTRLLLKAGRLLLEYNESTAAIHRAITSTAKALNEEACHVAVSYGGVTISLAGEGPALESVRELRYNTAVQARVHEILSQVRLGRLDAETALTQLNRVEAETPPHSRWLVTLALGAAAASLAGLLGADLLAAVVAGLASGLGLLARRELGLRHFSLLALPLTAALIGAVLGGLAGLDPNSRACAGRAGTHGGAGAALDQRSTGHDRQLPADEHGPAGAGGGHPARQRPGNRRRG